MQVNLLLAFLAHKVLKVKQDRRVEVDFLVRSLLVALVGLDKVERPDSILRLGLVNRERHHYLVVKAI